MDCYIISGQPYELLYKQLRDPVLSLQDVESFFEANREIRELGQKDLFRKLREGKRVMVYIEVEFDAFDTNEKVLHITLIFHHYIKTFQTTWRLMIGGTENDYDFKEIFNLPVVLKELEKKTTGVRFFFFDNSLIKLFDQTVEISTHMFESQYKLPFNFFESIWKVIRSLKNPAEIQAERNGVSGIARAKILLNGDVIYE